MKRFITSILPFVSLPLRTFSADTSHARGVKLFTTNKISFFLLVTFFFTVKAFSQTPGDGSLKIDGCFLAVKIDLKTQRTSISKSICVGDKITVKLKDNKIHGRISNLSKDFIVVADNYEIDVSKIKWIKKSKLTASRAIVSVLVTAGGLALLPASQEAASFEDTGIMLVAGAALVPIGIVIFVSRTKFQLERGDKLIFEEIKIAETF